MRVLVAGGGTGGHLMPALAIAEGIREARPDIEPVMIGSERGIERTILPTRSFRYHLLPAEPIYRREWWKNGRWIRLAPRLVRSVDAVIDAERPSAVIGTGGYASGPVLWRAARRGIATAIHEANAFPGLVTRLMAKRIDHLYLGFADAQDALPSGRRGQVLVTGNPVRPPHPIDRTEARATFGLSDEGVVVLVTGGSQGALRINEAVRSAVEAGLLRAVSLIWSTGKTTHDQYAHLAEAGHVAIRPFIDPIEEAYAAADIVVGRAGAMTVAELAAWGLPAILVPLPTAAHQHQLFNARTVEADGAAVVVTEDRLEHTLAETIMALQTDPDRLRLMREAQLGRARVDATRTVVSSFLTLVP